MRKDLIHEIRVTGRRTADISVPCTHCPAGRKICIKRDGIRVVFDQLEGCDELRRSLRQSCNTGSCENSLVINDTLRIARRGNTVRNAVKRLVLHKQVLLCKDSLIAERLEIGSEIFLVDRAGDHADVAPIRRRKTRCHILLIVGDAFIGDLDIRIDLVEFLDIIRQSSVNKVRAVGEKFELHVKVSAVLTDDKLIEGLAVGIGRGSGGLCGACCRLCRCGGGVGGLGRLDCLGRTGTGCGGKRHNHSKD